MYKEFIIILTNFATNRRENLLRKYSSIVSMPVLGLEVAKLSNKLLLSVPGIVLHHKLRYVLTEIFWAV